MMTASLLVEATIKDYPIIQNMARFYVYDMSKSSGHLPGWELPADGLYEAFDFKSYFTDNDRKAFKILVDNELAGFVLINQEAIDQSSGWNVGEFFVLAKFQGQGVGQTVAIKLWNDIPGCWEVSVMPTNKEALKFWERTVTVYTKGDFQRSTERVEYDSVLPERVVFRFDSSEL